MHIADWIETNQLTLESVADQLGLADPSVVSKYRLGRQIPRADIMRRIFVLTGGRVAPNDFYDLPEIQLDLPMERAA